MKMHCSLTICPHLVSLFLVGEKPVSFYAAFISVCIDISLVVQKKKRKKIFWLSSRKEEKSYLSELLFHSLIRFSFPLKTSMLHGMLTYWCFCKRECT